MLPQGAFNDSMTFGEKLAAADRFQLQRSLPCVGCDRNGQQCRLPDVDLDTGGLPCVDFSTAGKKRRQEGPTSGIFVAWAKRHKTLRTKLVILENTSVT